MTAEYNFLMFIRENMTSEFMDGFMSFISMLGDGGMIWIVLGIALLCFKKTRICGVFVLLSMLLGFLMGNVALKNIFGRMRPYDKFGVDIIIPPLSDYSFPSGHTLSSFAAALAIYKTDKRYGAAALVFASLMAFSRLYLFVHYPTDIVGGIALAFLSSYRAEKIMQKVQKTKNKTA